MLVILYLLSYVTYFVEFLIGFVALLAFIYIATRLVCKAFYRSKQESEKKDGEASKNV